MDLEIFDENYIRQVRLVVEVYKNENEVIPNWWLEISDSDDFEPQDLLAIAPCFNSIERQIESLVRSVE